MHVTAIGICTYNRPEGLSATLASLQRLQFREMNEENVFIVVVDNSAEASAAGMCRDYSSRFPIFYRHEPRKGLSNARNAAIDEASSHGAARLAFIDDDEVADANWLEELHGSMQAAGSIIAAGPTYPLFAEPPSRWVPVEAYAYVPAVHADGTVADASSANMMIDIVRLERLGIRFAQEFNESGGEDTNLNATLGALGEKIAWAENAVVWDGIPRARMQARWLFKRWFRTGTTEARVLTPEFRSVRGRLTNVAKGSVRVGYGIVRIAAGALKSVKGGPAHLVASCFTLCRGMGYLAGAAGQSYTEYSAKRYR